MPNSERSSLLLPLVSAYHKSACGGGVVMRNPAVLAACAGLFGAVILAQSPGSPQATFRSGVDLVQVEVSVLDKDRHPVAGLTAADFTVREDGKPRPIIAFTAVSLPAR